MCCTAWSHFSGSPPTYRAYIQAEVYTQTHPLAHNTGAPGLREWAKRVLRSLATIALYVPPAQREREEADKRQEAERKERKEQRRSKRRR